MKHLAAFWGRRLLTLSLLLLTALVPAVRAQEIPLGPYPAEADAALGTAITYQGILQDGAQPANGAFDFRMTLYNAATGGAQVGSAVLANDVAVAAGRFNALLDFGNVFGNTALWLEIAVRPGTSTGAYTVLNPRQPITPAPFARYAVRSTTATSATSANTAAALSLPWSATQSNAFQTLLEINNPANGRALALASGSEEQTLRVENFGNGNAAYLSNSTGGNVLRITSNGADGYGAEVQMLNTDNNRAALYARTFGTGFAIDAEINSNTSADAIFARTTSSDPASLAGYFAGDVLISGNLAKSSGSFKIDHPLDPANKYLQHSFVESPDMMNVYNGNVVLDGAGAATVTLPDYFAALNRDFRYQLTAVGAASPNLHVAQKIVDNQFRIAGGAPNGEVSWQVTGIRQDAWAQAHPIEVEVSKAPQEQGYYLHPELFGQPAAASIDQMEHPLYPPIQPAPSLQEGTLP